MAALLRQGLDLGAGVRPRLAGDTPLLQWAADRARCDRLCAQILPCACSPTAASTSTIKTILKPAVEREVTSFSGLGLLIALFLATPIPWRRRGKLLGLSALALLCFHLIALWGLIAIWDAMFRGGGISFGMRWAYMLIASGDWLAPLASWGLLGYAEIAAQRIRSEKGGGAHASV
jgi:hypothetical protein